MAKPGCGKNYFVNMYLNLIVIPIRTTDTKIDVQKHFSNEIKL